jgi:hypothetical protein
LVPTDDRCLETVKERIRARLSRFRAEDKPPKNPAERKRSEKIPANAATEPAH